MYFKIDRRWGTEVIVAKNAFLKTHVEPTGNPTDHFNYIDAYNRFLKNKILYRKNHILLILWFLQKKIISNLRFVIAESNFFPGDIFFFVLEFLEAKNMFIGKKL